MSRLPNRTERLAAKGRPKRRAAKTHFFKYQLATNPTRAEENDLKRALQESLEDQHYHTQNGDTKTNNNKIKVNSLRSYSSSTSSSNTTSTPGNSRNNLHKSNHHHQSSDSSTTNSRTKTSSDTTQSPKQPPKSKAKKPTPTKKQRRDTPYQRHGLVLNGSGLIRNPTNGAAVFINKPTIISNGSITAVSSHSSESSKSNNSSSSSHVSVYNSTSINIKRINDCSLARDQTIDLSNNQFKVSLTSTPLITNASIRSIGSAGSSNNSSGIGASSITNNSASVFNGIAGSSHDNHAFVIIDNKRIHTPTNVKITKKRSPPGSWSLLGVPEEKVIYLRDDEPPKRLICYPAIKHVEGDVIKVRDSVLLRSGPRKTDLPFIAKVCAFWEDAETGSVMMSLYWYYRPEHTEEGRKSNHLPDEIFASRHRDVDSVECIEDKCYVLTFNEYCRYRKRCKMEQVNTTWSLADVTIPVSNESYPSRNRIPDSDVNPELVFCCRQIYDAKSRRLVKNPFINPKYGYS